MIYNYNYCSGYPQYQYAFNDTRTLINTLEFQVAQLSANQTLMQAQQALINKLLNESCYGQQVRVDKLLKETCCEQLQPQEYSTKVITPVNNNEEEDWFLKGGRLAYVGSIFADIYKVEEIHETLKNKIINKLIDFLKKL